MEDTTPQGDIDTADESGGTGASTADLWLELGASLDEARAAEIRMHRLLGGTLDVVPRGETAEDEK